MKTKLNVLAAAVAGFISTAHADTTPVQTAMPAAMTSQATQRWIQGSWVNVRARNAIDAAIVGTWKLNTPVRVLAREGAWCEADDAKGLHGFVECDAIGSSALKLSDVDLLKEDGSFNEAYDPVRAFWLAPSTGRLIEAGLHFNRSLIDEAQMHAELIEHKAIRPTLPEFEAMKAALAEGVTTAYENETKRHAIWGAAENDPRLEGLRRLIDPARLPKTGPSLFLNRSEVAIVGVDGIDAIAAVTQQPMQVKTARAPQYYEGHFDSGIDGAWDVGALDVSLSSPAILHAVDASGAIAAARYAGERVEIEVDGECNEGFASLPRNIEPLAGYPTVDAPIVAFYTAHPLTAGKTKVTASSRQYTMSSAREEEEHRQGDATLYEIDLNDDRRPDIVVWQAQVEGYGDLETVESRTYFINVDGHWEYGGNEVEQQCGC